MTETRIEMAGIDIRSSTIIGLRIDCAGRDRGEIVRDWVKKIQNSSPRARNLMDSPDYVLLTISLDVCDGQASYRTIGDIPLVDVPCPCGDPNHWLIKYQEVP